jgi:hypothetical protein
MFVSGYTNISNYHRIIYKDILIMVM